MSYVDSEQWQPQGIEELEDRAWAALRETDRSVCVTAGAGAGKTEFLAQKATYLLQTGLCPPPKRILAISFKRDAAETLSKRVRLRCHESDARRFVSMTFDAFTKSLIDQFRLAIPAPYTPPDNYQISFPTNPILRDFLDRAEVHGITPDNFGKGIALAKLPIAEQHDIPEKWRNALRAYWLDQYEGQVQPFLTFPMINGLRSILLARIPMCSRFCERGLYTCVTHWLAVHPYDTALVKETVYGSSEKRTIERTAAHQASARMHIVR